MEEWEIEEMLRNLRSRRNINTSHIQAKEYELTWSKVWNGAKKVFRFVAPIVAPVIASTALGALSSVVTCLLM
jgi:hypothetical protein